MTKSKLVVRKVTTLPDEFLSAARPGTRFRHLPSCIAIAYDNRYVTDEDGTPLLFIWAHRNSLLSRKLELCMIPTVHLRARHALEARELVWAWVKEQTCEVFSRCNAPNTRRFLDWIGFTLVEESDGIIKYRAIV